MVVKESRYNSGNTALKPERKVNRPKRSREIGRETKREKRQKLSKQHKSLRNSVFQVAFLIFVLGMIIIWRDSRVYTMQQQIGDIETEMKAVENSNEQLKVDLLKASSLDSIEQTAKGKLKMKLPDKKDVINISPNDENTQKK